MSVSVLAFIKLKDALNDYLCQSKVDLAQINQKIHQSLYEYYKACQESIDPVLYKDDNLLFLEEICLGKKFNVLRSHQKVLRLVYSTFIVSTPGYITRNIVNSLISICNNKLASSLARELALLVLADTFEKRMNDTASLVTDALQLVQKSLKTTDSLVRLAAMRIMITIVTTDIKDMQDTFVDIFKIVGKLMNDKDNDVRKLTACIIRGISARLSSFTALSVDALVSSISKGLEDEDNAVQDACAKAIACVYESQVRQYQDKQEQSKIGAARGSDDPQQPKQQQIGRISLPKFASSRKVVVDEVLDFKTVLESIVKIVLKATGVAKVGYLFVLGYYISELLPRLSTEEIELVAPTFLVLLQDQSTQSLSYDEQTLLKARLSYIFRISVLAEVNEPQLLSLASHLCKLCNSMDGGGNSTASALALTTRSELELQFALSELCHILSILSSAAVSLQDEVFTTGNLYLRSASFAIRTISANLLLVMAYIVPGVGADLLRLAFTNTKTQAHQLMQYDNNNISGFLGDSVESLFDESSHGNASSAPAATQQPSRRNSLKDGEKMQRMFFFHGHALLVGLIVKHLKKIPNGVPNKLLQEAFELAAELMGTDTVNVPASSKHIVCSIVRAGALILSSYLTLGYEKCLVNIGEALLLCQKVIGIAPVSTSNSVKDASSGRSSPLQQRSDDSILFEVMTVEASLVVYISLLSNCKEVFVVQEQSMLFIVESLETCFRNMKNKYQPSFRNHFRLRTFHCILLECFTLLPAGSYPNTSQQIYIEALRVYRDSISLGCECSYEIFNGYNLLSPGFVLEKMPSLDSVVDERAFVYKLESNSNVLQKKESEAFLAIFGRDVELLTYFTEECSAMLTENCINPSIDSSSCPMRCTTSIMDTRIFDVSILLLAQTFTHQNSEYQEKAITLFTQASAQLLSTGNSSTTNTALTKAPTTKTSGISLFGNAAAEEERKRKEKKQDILHKDIITVLYYIMTFFPKHNGSYFNAEYAWRQKCIDFLFEVIGQSTSSLIQRKAGQALTLFASKWTNSQIVSSISQKTLAALLSTYSNTKKTVSNTMSISDGYIGYILTLGHLFTATSDHTNQSLITTTLIDCIRKMEHYSVTFQTAVLYALSIILQNLIERSTKGRANTVLHDADMLLNMVNVLKLTTSNYQASNSEYFSFLQVGLALVARAIVLLGLYKRFNMKVAENIESDLWYILEQTITLAEYNKETESYNLLVEEVTKSLSMIAKYDISLRVLGKLSPYIVSLTNEMSTLSLPSVYAIVSTVKYYLASATETNDKEILAITCEKLLSDHYEYILLSLLEHSVNLSIGSILGHHTTSFGVEIHNDYCHCFDSIQFVTVIINTIWTTLERIMYVDIDLHLETRLLYWVSLFNAMALELGQKASSSLEAAAQGGAAGAMADVLSPTTDDNIMDRDDQNEDSNEASNTFNSYTSIHSLFNALEKSTYTIDNSRHFLTLYRDLVTKLSSTSGISWRVYLKGYMLKLIDNIFMKFKQAIVRQSSHVEGRNCITVARETIDRQINASNHSLTIGMLLNNFPVPLHLYLNELITLVCNMISYTVNEKHVISLQRVSIHILLQAIQLFGDILDPDSTEQDSKILSLYISQIFSATRTCLTINHQPAILHASIILLYTCYKEDITVDYTSLKRIFKPIITYLQETHKKIDLISAGRCEDNIALQEQIVHAFNIAQYYSLLHNTSKIELQKALKGLITEHLESVAESWQEIVLDALRILFSHSNGNYDDALEVAALIGGNFYSSANLQWFSQESALFKVLDTVLSSSLSYLCQGKTKRQDCFDQIRFCVLYRLNRLYIAKDESVEEESAKYIRVLQLIAEQHIYPVPYKYWQAIFSLHVCNHSEVKVLGIMSTIMGDKAYEADVDYSEYLNILLTSAHSLVFNNELGSIAECSDMNALSNILVSNKADVKELLVYLTAATKFLTTLPEDKSKGQAEDVQAMFYLIYVLGLLLSLKAIEMTLFAKICGLCGQVYALIPAFFNNQEVEMLVFYMLNSASFMVGKSENLNKGSALQFSLILSTYVVHQETNSLHLPTYHKLLVQLFLKSLGLSDDCFAVSHCMAVESAMVIISVLTAQEKARGLQSFLQCLLPVVVMTYPVVQISAGNIDGLCSYVKLLLLCYQYYNNCQPDRVHSFLETILPLLAVSVQRHGQYEQYVAICGKACMHLYSQSAESFKQIIANSVSDELRTALQLAMKTALSSEQNNSSNAQHSYGSSTSAKTLNVNKFKK